MNASTGPGPGTAACAFGLKVGSQGQSVQVKTRNDFRQDPSYVFPDQGTTPAPGLANTVIQTTNTNAGTITARLGSNAIEITVDFYTKPVDNALLTTLMKRAISRV